MLGERRAIRRHHYGLLPQDRHNGHIQFMSSCYINIYFILLQIVTKWSHILAEDWTVRFVHIPQENVYNLFTLDCFYVCSPLMFNKFIREVAAIFYIQRIIINIISLFPGVFYLVGCFRVFL